MLNLDTHMLIYALRGDVTRQERRLLAGQEWSVSAIVWWELTRLIALGRITVNLEDVDVALALQHIHVWPVTLDICCESACLDFAGDVADGLIAATSIVHNVPLLTRDKKILRSKIVPFA